ncbi:MAG: D-alanyl-D-alanine carboxypeptidase [Alphaproteobacteria bacterium]|nr:D-alanyl-D-alanine carboxypeptidase [Alphaproteobacteria bacterium]
MKVIIAFFLSVAMFVAVAPQEAAARYASMVIDADSGRVLHAVNEDTRNYPASLTKIMTLYMAFDALRSGQISLDTKLKVSRRAAGMAPSKLNLRPGDTITVEDAILALVTKSANDVAVVIAEGLGGTEIEFARMMTERARQIGMSRTTFRNASGLPNRRQLSTARDMALLGLRIREDHAAYYDYFATTHFKFGGRTYKNHNTLLSSYEGTDGIKTGYTRASGFNLVASVEREGYRLIGVVFGGKTGASRDKHMKTLLDKGFAKLFESDLRQNEMVALNVPAGPSAGPIEDDLPQGDAAADIDLTELQATKWTIQVGAFSRSEPARTVAQQAVTRLGAMGENRVVVVDSAGRLHRSRVAGFDKSSAFAACRSLKTQNMDCIVFAPRN